MKLIENNPLNDTNNIKYVRHKDTKSDIFNGSFFDTSSLEIYQKQQEKILTHPAAYYIIRNCDMRENTTPMPRWEYLI